MRILVVGPTGRTGSQVIDALRGRDPEVAIRGLCRYPEVRARSIEVIPGNGDGGTTRKSILARGIEVVPGNGDGGTTRSGLMARGIEVVPGNGDGGTTRSGLMATGIEVVPGNGDGGTTRSGLMARGIEVVPGNGDGGTTRSGLMATGIEVVPGNGDGGTTRMRSIEVVPGNGDGGTTRRAHTVECLCGDLENPQDRALAVDGVDVVIHYAPAFHPREAAMGTGLIDAAVAAGVRRFIYVSALGAPASGVPGHAAKLSVEGYLADSGLEWTVLRPQGYMQNIDVPAALAAGALDLPFPLAARQGRVDLTDVAEAVARVAFEDGHAFASYDLASDEALSTAELAALITTLSGQAVAAGEMAAGALVAALEVPGHPYVAEAAGRLNAWQARTGGRGNANVLRWLLGREPGRFEDYAKRELAIA